MNPNSRTLDAVRLYRSVFLQSAVPRRPTALRILVLIAVHVWCSPGIDRHSCQVGEAFVGGSGDLGRAHKAYRFAQKPFRFLGVASFKATSQGGVGWLMNSMIFAFVLGRISTEEIQATSFQS